uniref:Synaptosomal-associated protein 47 n=1 Tax=Junco hyemalis TaxID=40217 RepID=A0A8C5JAN3_JUNHY
MNEDIRIHSWPCSYYLDSSKQWIPGKLSLTPTSIKFTADKSGELLADFQLSGISEIKKESSHLIFSSLTVLEKGAKHWFGSLHPNRNAVFNVLEHFWREQLLPGREGAAGAASGPSKGRELSGMLEGSQKRLEDTAKVLQAQGEQFDSIMRGLHKIEGDMDVADRFGMGAFPQLGYPISNIQYSVFHIPYLISHIQYFISVIQYLIMDIPCSIATLTAGSPPFPRQILQKLKGLALETEAELERQDEALDSIGSSVDRATLTIERQNRRMRKLT